MSPAPRAVSGNALKPAPRAALLGLAAILALLLQAAPARADFAEGVKAYEEGRFGAAFAAWAPLADQGDTAAMRNLGHLYRWGQGVEKDLAKAEEWYRRAAALGFARAQANLAALYLNGEGVKQDYAEAAKWFEAAARQGHAVAQYNLGLLYELGLGVPKDEARALGWYNNAAKAGQRDAIERLSMLVMNRPAEPALALNAASRTDDTRAEAAPSPAAMPAAPAAPVAQPEAKPEPKLQAAVPPSAAAAAMPAAEAKPEAAAEAKPETKPETAAASSGGTSFGSVVRYILGISEPAPAAPAAAAAAPEAAPLPPASAPAPAAAPAIVAEKAQPPAASEASKPESLIGQSLARAGSEPPRRGDVSAFPQAMPPNMPPASKSWLTPAPGDSSPPAAASPPQPSAAEQAVAALSAATAAPPPPVAPAPAPAAMPAAAPAPMPAPDPLQQAQTAFDGGDYIGALGRWMPLASAGNPEAQAAVARLYRDGLGLPADRVRALAWYRLAADKGNAPAEKAASDLAQNLTDAQRDEAAALARRLARPGS